MKSFLFICGCPRSGTTALARLLNLDPRFAIGLERYFRRSVDRFSLTPELFERARFFDLQPGDTFWADLSHLDFLQDRFDSVEYRGDKVPRLYEQFDQLFAAFPDARCLFVLRNIVDVAASYNVRARNVNDKQWSSDQDFRVAVRDWNRSINAFLAAKEEGRSIRLVVFEEIFSDIAAVSKMYQWCGLDLDADADERVRAFLGGSKPVVNNNKVDLLTGAEKKFILEYSDFAAYRQALSFA